MVSDADIPNVHHMHPNISLAPNGRIDVVWLDNRNSPIPAGIMSAPGVTYIGHHDVWWSYSLDQGRTFSEGIKINDRIIDRRFGIWQGNADIHGPTGIVSSDDAVYFAWQDSRNGTNEGSADDTYFASVHLDGTPSAIADDDDESVPDPVLIGAGLAIGMGLAMLVVFAVTRRSRVAG